MCIRDRDFSLRVRQSRRDATAYAEADVWSGSQMGISWERSHQGQAGKAKGQRDAITAPRARESPDEDA
eukprot:3496131-Amphidinium_carterae.1